MKIYCNSNIHKFSRLAGTGLYVLVKMKRNLSNHWNWYAWVRVVNTDNEGVSFTLFALPTEDPRLLKEVVYKPFDCIRILEPIEVKSYDELVEEFSELT